MEKERPSIPIRVLGPVLATVLTAGAIAWAGDLFRVVGLNIYTEQFLAGMLAVAFPLLYTVLPARRGTVRLRVPWYDAIAGLAGAATGAFVAVEYEMILQELYTSPIETAILGAVILVLVVEGLRRTTGPVLVIVVLTFVAFGLVGHFMPGQLQGREVALNRLVIYLSMDSNGLFGVGLIVTTTIVVTFVFFGHLLSRSGGSDFFTDLSMALMGRYRGGASKIAVTSSALFGSISGSAVDNVMGTGVITIPLMRRSGYNAHSAAAIEAVASTGGQLMPPIMGAAAFLMAEFLQVPYREVMLAAVIPAGLYYLALFIQADLVAAREGISRVEEDRIPRILGVLRKGWMFPVPFIVIVWALFGLNERPETAVLYATASLIAIGLVAGYGKVKLRPGIIVAALASTGVAVLDIIMIGAAAGIIIGVLNISALGFALTQTLATLGEGNMLALLGISAAVCILLGIGMPTVGVYVLLATLVAPSLVEVGIGEIAAHLYVLYFGMMSLITPPVAVAAFAAATLAGAGAMRTAVAAVRFGWPAFVVPFLFVYAPEFLLIGETLDIVIAVGTALGGVWLGSVAIAGYLVRPMDPLSRLALGVAAACLLPADVYGWGRVADLAGLLIAVPIFWRELAAGRRLAASRAPGNAPEFD